METDKIKADDALISTDVDRLIRIISEKRKLNFVDLQRLSGIRNKQDLETWIRVLEDEGYVRVEYSITGVYVIWAGGDYYTQTEDVPVKEQAVVKKSEEKEAVENKIEDEAVEEDAVLKEENEKTPEELLEEYVKMKHEKEIGASEAKDDVKEHDEPALDSKDVDFKDEDEIKSRIMEQMEDEAKEEKEREQKETMVEEPLLPEEDKSTEIVAEEEPASKSKVVDNEIYDLVAAYMEEINEERAKLEQLKRKKENFYKEELSALQKMSEVELISFMDAILAHEKKLLELRESVLELPEKVNDAVKLKNELKRLSEEGRNAAKQTKEKVEQLSLALKASQQDIVERIDELRTAISDNEKRINALESIKESIDGRATKIELSMEAVKTKIEELNGMLHTLQEYLDETKKTKDEISAALSEMKKVSEEKRAELEEIEQEFDELNKLSGWIREYVNDYDSKIAEIDETVQKSERDIVALKQAAEAAYLKRYLKELQNLSEKYEDKLDNAIKTEKEINAEIDAAKSRISELVKQSQRLLERIGSETRDIDYESVKKRAEARSKKLRSLVDEKETEKKNLSESIKKRKKGKK